MLYEPRGAFGTETVGSMFLSEAAKRIYRQRTNAAAVTPEKTAALQIPWPEQILLFLAFAVFLSIGPENPTPQLGRSNIESTLGQAGALAISVPFLLFHRREIFPFILRSPLLVSFIILAFASVVWSVFPALTFRRDASLVAPVLVGLVAAYRYEAQDVIRFTGRFCLLLTAVSLIVVIAFPSVGIMHDRYNPEIDGAWRGFTPHKSVFGIILVLGFEIYVWRAFLESKRRWLHAGIALAMLIVCLLARSSTAFIAMGFTVPLLAIIAARRSETRMRWLPDLAFVGLLIFGLLFLPFLLTGLVHLLGKDVSLTGRIPLWQSLIPFIEARPWLGYGYGAFWVSDSPQMIRVTQLNSWRPPDAHNAYLGVALELGLTGAIIATCFLLSVIWRAYQVSRSTGFAWASYFFVFAFIYAITNMVETPLLAMGSFFTFMLAFCHFGLVKHALKQASQNVPAPSRRGPLTAETLAAQENAEPGPRFRRINARSDSDPRNG